ncbi:MAG TPA: DUF5074 domain-containing protein [Mucilaginibacter sp.]
MKKQTTKLFIGVISIVTLAFTSCKKDEQAPLNGQLGGKSLSTAYSATVTGKYTNGFFIINEGWYGHGDGSVSFYNYATSTKQDSIFTTENPGKNLDPKTSTVEYGAVFNDKLFIVSKVGGPVVVTDANTLKELGRVPAASGNNWQAFLGLSTTSGLLSSASGLYPFNLTNYTVGTKLTTITGSIGDMTSSGNYIFVLSQSQGVVVLNASNFSVAKTIPGMLVAFAKTPDGSVWAAGGTSLIKINPATLAVTTITVPFTVNGSWAAWHPGSITASTSSNIVYLAQNNTWYGGTNIYKYIDGNAASLNAPFITVPVGKELYGSGVAYNASNGQLVVNTVKSGFGNNYSTNDLDFYNATTGALISDLPFSGFYFPALVVFH